MSATARVVLPDPLSPMTATVSPSATSNETPRTAWTGPRREPDSMARSRTESSAGELIVAWSLSASARPEARVEHVLETRRERDQRQLEERDREDRAEDVPESVGEIDRALAQRKLQHHAPVRAGQRDKPEHDQPDLGV